MRTTNNNKECRRKAWNSVTVAASMAAVLWATPVSVFGAEQDIRALSGVVGVSNQVSIRPKAIASNVKDEIEQALRRSSYHDTDTIKVNVLGGEIKLTGVVGVGTPEASPKRPPGRRRARPRWRTTSPSATDHALPRWPDHRRSHADPGAGARLRRHAGLLRR